MKLLAAVLCVSACCLFKIGHVRPQGIDASVKLRASEKKNGSCTDRKRCSFRGVDEATTLSVVSSFLHNVVTVQATEATESASARKSCGAFSSRPLPSVDPAFVFFCYQEVIKVEAAAVILCCCRGVYLLSPVPSARLSGAAAEEMGNQMSDIPSAALCSDLCRPAVSKLHSVLN